MTAPTETTLADGAFQRVPNSLLEQANARIDEQSAEIERLHATNKAAIAGNNLLHEQLAAAAQEKQLVAWHYYLDGCFHVVLDQDVAPNDPICINGCPLYALAPRAGEEPERAHDEQPVKVGVPDACAPASGHDRSTPPIPGLPVSPEIRARVEAETGAPMEVSCILIEKENLEQLEAVADAAKEYLDYDGWEQRDALVAAMRALERGGQ